MHNIDSTKKRKKIHLLPNLITAFGLSCGLFAIFYMALLAPEKIDYQALLFVTGILILAALSDLLDGAVARLLRAESDFGALFDSLADAVSFGVAPSVVILKSLNLTNGSQLAFFATTSAMIFAVCGVLRLVRFNINSLKAKGDEELTLANKKNFTGVPIPVGAAAVISLNLFLASLDVSGETRIYIMSSALIFIGYFMISRLKFPSIKALELRVNSFQLVVFTVICALFLFFGVLHYFSAVFLLSAWGYLVIGWSLSLARYIAGKKSSTLEDFEPEDDDLEEDE